MFVLDTNTFIFFFKKQGRVAERLLAVPPSEVLMPTAVLYELELGSLQSSAPRKRREQLEEILHVVELAPFGAGEARAAARVRAELEREGRAIGPIDTLIAGTAISRSATLVTHNREEFSRVRGLKVEDWY